MTIARCIYCKIFSLVHGTMKRKNIRIFCCRTVLLDPPPLASIDEHELQRRSDLCIPRNETAQPHFQFLTMLCSFIPGSICFALSVECLCSVYLLKYILQREEIVLCHLSWEGKGEVVDTYRTTVKQSMSLPILQYMIPLWSRPRMKDVRYWPHNYSLEKNQVPKELTLIAISLACLVEAENELTYCLSQLDCPAIVSHL